jgi:hypothetical protein
MKELSIVLLKTEKSLSTISTSSKDESQQLIGLHLDAVQSAACETSSAVTDKPIILHALIHFPNQIRLFSPPRYAWCLIEDTNRKIHRLKKNEKKL